MWCEGEISRNGGFRDGKVLEMVGEIINCVIRMGGGMRGRTFAYAV